MFRCVVPGAARGSTVRETSFNVPHGDAAFAVHRLPRANPGSTLPRLHRDVLLDLGLELVPIWIENERGVIGLPIVWSKSRTAFIVPTVGDGCGVKGVYGRAAWCNQREMKARPRSELHAGFSLEEQCDLSPGRRVRRTVANAAFRSPSPNPSEWRERRVIEGLSAIEIADAERDVPEHVGRLSRQLLDFNGDMTAISPKRPSSRRAICHPRTHLEPFAPIASKVDSHGLPQPVSRSGRSSMRAGAHWRWDIARWARFS